MADRAKITSIDAVDQFRGSLSIYIDKALRAVNEVSEDIKRTRMWLEVDQRLHWENRIRKLTKDYELAQAELFTARTAGLPEATTVRQNQVNKLKRELLHADDKLRILKKWARAYEHEIAPYAKQVENLESYLSVDMRKSVHFLGELLKILDTYSRRGDFKNADPIPSSEPLQEATAGEAKTDSGGQP